MLTGYIEAIPGFWFKIGRLTGRIAIKGGYWYMVFNFVSEDGKPRPKWETTKLPERNNKTTAKKMLAEELAKYNAMTSTLNNMSFVELFNKWIASKVGIRKNSHDSYSGTANFHVIPYFEELGLRVEEITPQIIKAYYDNKRANGFKKGTLTRHRTIIHSALQYAKDDLGILASNPAIGIVLPKDEDFDKLPNFYNVEELKILFEVIGGESIETAVRLAGTYGLCREEVLGLEWKAVNFHQKTIQIRKTAVKVNGSTKYDERVKARSRFRTMPLTSEMERYLLKLKAHQQKMKEYIGAAYQDNDLICKWDDGKPMTPDYITHCFPKLLKKYGLRHITFHQLRHSSASILVSNGHSLEEVQHWLGHKSRKSTEIYAHFQANPKLNMANTVETLLRTESGQNDI